MNFFHAVSSLEVSAFLMKVLTNRFGITLYSPRVLAVNSRGFLEGLGEVACLVTGKSHEHGVCVQVFFEAAFQGGF